MVQWSPLHTGGPVLAATTPSAVVALITHCVQQARTGVSLKKLVQTLRPLHTVTIDNDGHTLTAKPHPTDDAEQILAKVPPVTG